MTAKRAAVQQAAVFRQPWAHTMLDADDVSALDDLLTALHHRSVVTTYALSRGDEETDTLLAGALAGLAVESEQATNDIRAILKAAWERTQAVSDVRAAGGAR